MSAILGNTPLGTVLMTLISFILVIYFVYKFAWKPISKVMEERQEYITQELNDVNKQKKETADAVLNAKQSVEESMLKAQDIINNAKSHATDIARRIEDEARDNAEKLRKKTDLELSHQRQQFHREMEDSVVTISVMMAQKVIGREISEEDHREFIHEYIERLDAETK